MRWVMRWLLRMLVASGGLFVVLLIVGDVPISLTQCRVGQQL